MRQLCLPWLLSLPMRRGMQASMKSPMGISRSGLLIVGVRIRQIAIMEMVIGLGLAREVLLV